jgi:hypothetical protein
MYGMVWYGNAFRFPCARANYCILVATYQYPYALIIGSIVYSRKALIVAEAVGYGFKIQITVNYNDNDK